MPGCRPEGRQKGEGPVPSRYVEAKTAKKISSFHFSGRLEGPKEMRVLEKPRRRALEVTSGPWMLQFQFKRLKF